MGGEEVSLTVFGTVVLSGKQGARAKGKNSQAVPPPASVLFEMTELSELDSLIVTVPVIVLFTIDDEPKMTLPLMLLFAIVTKFPVLTSHVMVLSVITEELPTEIPPVSKLFEIMHESATEIGALV